jgi:hypothetical protein
VRAEVGDLGLLALLGGLLLDLGGDLDGLVDVVGDLVEVLWSEATGGHGWGTDTEAAWDQGGLVAWDGVLVGGDVDELEDGLDAGAVDLLWLQVNEDQVGVGAAGDKGVTALFKGLSKDLSVVNNVLLVFLELRGGGLAEGDCKRGDGVVVRTALVAREDGEVDLVLQVVVDWVALLVVLAHALSEEDDGASGSAEGLVGGGGDNVRIFKRRWGNAGGDQPGGVGHVGHQVGVDRVGDLLESAVIQGPGIGRRAGHKDLGSEELDGLLQHVKVDQTRAFIQTVRHGLEVLGHIRDLLGRGLVAVGKMASMGKVETHESVANLHEGRVNVQVGWRTRKRLNVHSPLLRVEAEGGQSPLLTETLALVNVLVAAVITGTRIPLGILVLHLRAKNVHDGLGGEVLGRNERHRLLLSGALAIDDVRNLLVDLLDRLADHGLLRNGSHELLQLALNLHSGVLYLQVVEEAL